MKIQFKGLFIAIIPAVLAYSLIDSLVEFSIARIVGISFIKYFEQELHCHYGIQFYLLNFVAFSCEMLMVMFFYASIRPLFNSISKPVVISTLFFICFTGLFLAQLINLGLYPVKPAILFGISTVFSLPAAMYMGANTYERYFKTIDPAKQNNLLK